MRSYFYAALVGAAVCPGVFAQQASPRLAAVQDFQRQHPGAQLSGAQFGEHLGLFDESSTATTVSGTTLAVGASALESAQAHVNEIGELLGSEIGELLPKVRPDGAVTLGVMFDRDTQTYGFTTFRFQQAFNGIPVFRSGAGFLVRNDASNSLVMSTFDVKELADMDPAIAGNPQTRAISSGMLASTRGFLNGNLLERGLPTPSSPAQITPSEEELVIWAGTNGQVAAPELAMKFIATRGSDRFAPELFQRHLILISVATNEILYTENLVNEFVDVSGTVTGRATQGLNSLECDPEVEVPLPYIEANILGGNSTFADVNGQFTISHGGAGAVTVRSPLRGEFFEVFDDLNGQTTPVISTSVTPPGPANLIHNPTAGQDSVTAGVNAYLEANVVRDYTLSYAPNYPTISTQTAFDLIVNEDNFSGITSCNAVYTGSSLVFWRNGGGCNNSAFTDVVHHEYGHHLVGVTGNGQGQFGEGSGDCMGVLIQDDPVLGQGFQTCGSGIRNANNNHQYPCNGAIHDCGQLISGCVWSLRNELIVTEPANYRDIGASLFINMMIVRGQMVPGSSTIDPLITVIYLTLDDDDANIGNGTPHYNEIATAFGDHNMDAPPLELLEFAFPDGRPATVSPAGGVVEFRVQVHDLTSNAVPGTGILYVDRGNGIEMFPMSQQSANLYEAVYPTLPCGPMTYYFSADATSGGTAFSPSGAPAIRYEATAANSVIGLFADNFESNMGWSVSGNAGDGAWDRGTPVGGGDRGDPAVDGDGSGQCFLTDNVDDNSDVDDGSTTLTSPALDASSAGANQEAQISYLRWYSNTAGGAPMADIFVVEISNNGGGSWVNVETVGPTGAEVSGGWIRKTIRVSDFVAPTNNVRIRFTASDLGTGSVVEAGVDGVELVIVDCDPGCTSVVENYCVSTVNSSGNAAQMGSSGSTSLSANNFSIEVSGAGLNKSGIFYFGGSRIQTTFGDGFRCVGTGHYGGTFRLFPVVTTDGTGALSRALNFGVGNAANIVPTLETNFQFWFRDPMGPGATGFNVSDGLSVTFCP